MYSNEELNKLPIFFIVGKGRSGTTLLQTMLDAHPNMMVPWESRFIIHLRKKYARITRWDEATKRTFAQAIFTDPKLRFFWGIDQAKFERALMECTITSFSEACKLVYLHFASPFKKEGIQMVGDKNPVNSLFIEELQLLFPEAKFIHLIRDYRGNLNSHLRTAKNKTLGELALRWVNINNTIKAAFATRNNYLAVSFETLLQAPEQELQRICSFLQMPYSDAMINYHQQIAREFDQIDPNNEQLKHRLASKFHANLKKPIDPATANRWQQSFGADNIETAEFYCSESGKAFGYTPTLPGAKGSGLSRFTNAFRYWKWYYKVRVFYNWMPFSFRVKRMQQSLINE